MMDDPWIFDFDFFDFWLFLAQRSMLYMHGRVYKHENKNIK
jgi:hypothetical protein